MDDSTAKRIASTGGGGGGGDKPVPVLRASAKPFVPSPVAYQREFETVAQQQFNALAVPLGYQRARSLSVGIYDPSTDMRTQRAHYHIDPLRPDAGQPIAKPDAQGRYGGAFTAYVSSPVKK